jgi:hypothetical protein
LDLDSTNIEVSDYLKDGGTGGDEWPWKVMKASLNPSDKWICTAKSGWIIYTFEKPIVIRGYGIISGNDFPSRDPVNWLFKIEDAVRPFDMNTDKWIVVDEVKNHSFNEKRHTLAKFSLKGGQRIVKSIMLDIT